MKDFYELYQEQWCENWLLLNNEEDERKAFDAFREFDSDPRNFELWYANRISN